MTGSAPDPAPKLRLDKWLWHARFFKTRSLAARQVSDGHVRINGTRASKPAQSVSPDDVLTFPQGRQIRVVRVLAIGTRRGPAPEAQSLYEDLTPEPEPTPDRVGARPTKRDRRAIDAFRDKSAQE
ncbi:MAG: RNA-binding S4 domain-containing protein [Pseudomonadota bacterium]